MSMVPVDLRVRKRLRRLFFTPVLVGCLSSGALMAQGWTFSFTLSSSGPCGAYMPVIPTFSVPYMTTQAYCESIRQSILNIRVSQPMYNEDGNYIGECAVFYTASSCTGADLSSLSGTDFAPGSVSIDGPMQGSAYFTPHQTQEFENWMGDFQVRLKSMGIEADQSAFQLSRDIPLTGDPDFDAFYMSRVLDFDKPQTGTKPPPIPQPVPEPAPVPASVETGTTVQLLTTSEEQRKRDEWMTLRGFNDLRQVGENNILDAGGSDPAEMSWSEAALREYVGDNVAGNYALKVADGTTQGISEVVGKLSRGDTEGAAEQAASLDRNIAINSAVETAKETITGGLTDLVTGPVLGLVKGAGTVSSFIGKGTNIWNTKHGK